MTLVSAPAGFGKRTLLGVWMPEIWPDRIKAGWLSLNENGMDIFSCTETRDLQAYGIRPGKCIDDDYS